MPDLHDMRNLRVAMRNLNIRKNNGNEKDFRLTQMVESINLANFNYSGVGTL